MSDPFIGEIRMFAGNFAPRSWAFCDGQLLAVSSNNALFALLGTIYGGDGRTTFGLPDMRGRIPVHQGQGPGLSDRRIGAKGGAENVTLTANQMPSHNHAMNASGTAGTADGPAGMVQAGNSAVRAFRLNIGPNQTLHSATIGNSGGSRSHANMMPTLAVHFIIALFGVFPSRN